ncbi:tetratricopeptide repeat protein [Rhodophyticola sp. CCM32]|uniref:tetratricopeptide repeat protein n=1 Tax=Rhodophyticola sp. CCM32 TaxID=2916397 RepID=UPI00107F9841|nr:tetratricopeptide repeat protein [Rhodophyticola sp. CCM32]QBY01192.1 tetratricopeptide repeat protein [Rhodophyticola sp. CCM32]
MMRGLIIFTTFLGLAACGDPGTGPLGQDRQGVPAPPGTHVLRNSVDGLVVGDRLMEAGEYELALRAYLRAAAEDGTTAQHLSALGSANLQLGRLGQAEAYLRQAVEEDPGFTPAWNNLGVVLMEQGEYGEARQVFQHAFALDSGQTDSIRENLRLAIARMENSGYIPDNNENRYDLERRGGGRWILSETP